MSESESRSELVLELAEEFLARHRKGERPSLKEYIDRHPELATEIKDVFPAMAMMEKIAVADSSLDGSESERSTSVPAGVAIEQLGDYRIIREIGHGGMGIVYEAEQVSLGRHVALKVLPNQSRADSKQKRRFEREAKAAAKLHHTNIVPVFGVGEHEGLPYYVMQFIQGLGLDVVLDELNQMQPGAAQEPNGLPTAGEIRVSRRNGPAAEMARSLMTGAFRKPADSDGDGAAGGKPTVAATIDQAIAQDSSRPAPGSAAGSAPASSGSFTVSNSSIAFRSGSGIGKKKAGRKQSYWQSVADIGRQVADALEYAHKQGVLHRDIKPSNLLLDLKGTMWVTDFGLAKVTGPSADNLTHTGDILGTLRYMPPEAFEGKSDVRGDIYSLGMTLYELLAMRPAFDEKDRHKLIKKVTTSEPMPLHKANRDTPRDLVTVIHKAIDRDPARRYATAEDMASDLQRFLDDEPILARRQSQAERYWRWARHNPGMAILGGVLTAVLLIATFASLIVAGQMSEAAAEERAAKNREVIERGRSELAKQDADQSRKGAEAALRKAEENFAKARAAVNDYLTAVSEDERLKAPGLQGLRVQLLQSALQFYLQFLKERGDDPTLTRELAGVHFKVGEIYRDLGQTQAMFRSYSEARRLYESLVSRSPNDPELEYGLAMALGRQGSPVQAIPILEKIIRPEDPKYHADLGELYSDVAKRTYSRAKTNPTELEYLRKSLAIRERLVRLSPDDPEAHLGLSGSLNNIAVRLNDDRSAEALLLLQRALNEVEIAYRIRPRHLETVRYLTMQLTNLSKFARKVGEADVALAADRRRVEILEHRDRENPTTPMFETELVIGYSNLVQELQRANLLDEANKAADKARLRIAEFSSDTGSSVYPVLAFRLNALDLAIARAKVDPAAQTNVETDAAAAIGAIRQCIVVGWRDPHFFRTASNMEALRSRRDWQDLMSNLDMMAPAQAIATSVSATPQEKLSARKTILKYLEIVAGPSSRSHLVRRYLAQARQFLAQALLDAGNAEEARVAFDAAILSYQRLLQESPSDEQLRADVTQSESAAGYVFAAADKLADAERVWSKALATLEDDLKANPVSIPYQSALSERLSYVAWQAAQFGRWDVAATHYRRAVEIQSPSDAVQWGYIALVAAETEDRSLLRAAGAFAAANSETGGWSLPFRLRVLTISPDTAASHFDAIEKLSDSLTNGSPNDKWMRALAYLRIGRADKASEAVAGLAPGDRGWPEWQVLALIQHRLGHAKEAAESLRQADLLAEKRMQEVVSADRIRLPLQWDEWAQNEALRAEAHRAIHGKSMPTSPYERLRRGRVLTALDRPDDAEIEFAAAVEVRPADAKVWLTRSRIFAKLGRSDRMTADLLHAQQLKGDNPRIWLETGRTLAEQGEQKGADAAFARAGVLGKGELNRFLEAGWWAVGPYLERIDLPGPPESNPDPSKPAAALGRLGKLKWQTVSTSPESGSIDMRWISGVSLKDASFYYLAYVDAERDRTATLNFRSGAETRIWIDGRLAFNGVAAWGITPNEDNRIPISLRAGRNTLLIKSQRKIAGNNGCECMFLDSPLRRAYEFLEWTMWSEAADSLTEAERRAPLDEHQTRLRLHALLAAGRDEEARRVFSELADRHDLSETSTAFLDFLPPEKTADRVRRLALVRSFANGNPSETYRFHRLANACLRAGEFAEAEKNLRKALVNDQLYFHPLLATILHYLGRPEDARKALADTEEQRARLVKGALAANRCRSVLFREEEVWYDATLREARLLILGHDPGPTADEAALASKARARFAMLEKIEDDFARAVEDFPDNPRLWIDRGRELGRLQRWNDAAKAFAKAEKLAPTNAQMWKERARSYADLGKWDEAAADFVKALELPDAGDVRDRIVRLDEVFPRVAKLRPTDQQLWEARFQYAGRSGRWREAAKAADTICDFDPNDHLRWHYRSIFPIHFGYLEQYRAECREMSTRFGKTKDILVAQRIAEACLLAPKGLDDPAVVFDVFRKKTETKDASQWRNANDPDEWCTVTLGLGHYRMGHPDKALKELANFTQFSKFSGVVALAVRAMAQFGIDQKDAARLSLAESHRAMDRLTKPGPDEAQFWWLHWLQADAVLREADALIPAIPMQVARAGQTAEQQTARQERKIRSESLTVRAALVQIQLDTSRKGAAESELRAILAEREKIAVEEPDNFEYQADRAAAHELLGRCLVSDARLEEGMTEVQQAVSALERFAPGNTRAARIRVSLGASLLRIAELHWNAAQMAEGRQAWQRAQEVVKASRDAEAKDPRIAQVTAKLELVAGRAYADLGLFSEASDNYRRAFAADPAAGNVSDRFNHAAILALTGDDAEYRRYCRKLYERGANYLDGSLGATLLILRPDALPDPKTTVSLTLGVQKSNYNDFRCIFDAAIAQLHSGQLNAGFTSLVETEKFTKDEWKFGWPSLALGLWKVGRTDEARDWLRKSEDWYAEEWSKHLAPDATGLTKDNFVDWAFFLTQKREATEAVTGRPAPDDAWLHLHRAQVFVKLGEPKKADAEFQAAIDANPDDSRILLNRSLIYAALGKNAEADADRGKARDLAEGALARNPNDQAAADAYMRFLEDKEIAKWSVLVPLELKSSSGTKLTRQPDDSVLASGAVPDRDTYTFEVEAQGPIAAFRLEAIADPRLPNGGPGRWSTGNFILTNFQAATADGNIAWRQAFADYSQPDYDVSQAIAARPTSGWAIHPRLGESHWAAFVPVQPVGGADKIRLTVRLAFQSNAYSKYSISRFRLSTTSDAALVRKFDWIAAVSPRAKVAAAYLALGEARQAKDYLIKAMDANRNATAADWLILALAHLQLREMDPAQKASRAAAKVFKPDGADASLLPLVRDVVVALGRNAPASKTLIAAANAGAPPAAMTEAIQRNPKNADAYENRGYWYGTRGRWKEAVADFDEANRLAPEPLRELKFGTLLVETGQIERYRDLCRTMPEQSSSVLNNSNADRTLKLVHLLPRVKGDEKGQQNRLARLLETALQGDKNADWYAWFQFGASLHEYRLGKYADALATCRASRARIPATIGDRAVLMSLDLVVESMALHGKGDLDAARRTLEQARTLIDGHIPGMDPEWWHDWLFAQILLRETEGLLADRKTNE